MNHDHVLGLAKSIVCNGRIKTNYFQCIETWVFLTPPPRRRYPRIHKESLLPVASSLSMSGQGAEGWYPPGHGDIYASFYNSGLLEQLIAQGREYIFVSNIDNLGATVDLHILHQLVSQPNGKRCEFIMEVTDKTRADVKVGAWRVGGWVRV